MTFDPTYTPVKPALSPTPPEPFVPTVPVGQWAPVSFYIRLLLRRLRIAIRDVLH